MGSSQQGCSQGCYSWVRGYSSAIQNLRIVYRDNFKNTVFFQICMQFVGQLHNLQKQGHGINEQAQIYKNSLIDSLYEQSQFIGINENIKNSTHTRISSFNQQEKKKLISDLIKKSYILLDISDIFEQNQTHLYEKSIKQKMFENDQSIITQSFLDINFSKQNIIESLRKFDTRTIYKLQKYCQLADLIKKRFDASDSLLNRFAMQLKSKLIERHNTTQNIDNLIKMTRTVIEILKITTIIIFDIKFQNNEYDQKKCLQKKYIAQETNDTISQQQHHIQFINETNLYTLVSCIVFDDMFFQQFYQKAIYDAFKLKMTEYKKRPVYADELFMSRILQQDCSMSSYFEPTLATLLNKKIKNTNQFQKTIKIFNKLATKPEPVLKLKLLSEMQKQFLKQIKKLSSETGKQIIYDRSKSQQMANWLINRDKTMGSKCIVSIIIAYSFVHNLYRLGGRGSTILSFVETVQNILSWNIPFQ